MISISIQTILFVLIDAYNHSSAPINIPVHGVSAQHMQQSAQHWSLLTFSLDGRFDMECNFVASEFPLNLGSTVTVLDTVKYQHEMFMKEKNTKSQI